MRSARFSHNEAQKAQKKIDTFSVPPLCQVLPPATRLKTSPGSHSAMTSNGRQQTSQSVVKRCDAMLVSMISSNRWPQKGH